MTTIEFGGGPTIEARPNIFQSPTGFRSTQIHGSHPPASLSSRTHLWRGNASFSGRYPALTRSKTDIPMVKYDQSDPYETREFPDGMLPGYTGYIPQRKYQLGNRYRVESDACLTGTKAAYERARSKARDMQQTIGGYPKTQDLNSGTVVKHFLDYHRAFHPTEGSKRVDRRAFVEPPIPGYRGFIPRIQPIDIGLGDRYHEATRKGLNRFAVETTNSMTNFPTNTDVDPSSGQTSNQEKFASRSLNAMPARSVSMLSTHRLYPNSGMIPKYTGYLPQRKYRIGQTYGETSRGLPICSHSSANFGDYVRSKSTMNFSSNDAD